MNTLRKTVRVHVFYRVAERAAAQPKNKPTWATKEACLLNALQTFGGDAIHVFGDRLSSHLRVMVRSLGVRLTEVDEGSGGGNFRAAARVAMGMPDSTVVYLLEDDFFHMPRSAEAIHDGLSLGASYVTLYDHPDKYIDRKLGGNPHVTDGGEKTILLCGQVTHWKMTNSTVMTFAATAGQLRKDWKIFSKHCSGRYTDDYRLFRSLSWRGRKLLSAVPGLATHCETQFLSPFVDWGRIATETMAPEHISVIKAVSV
jgi:hypothetical protein